MLAIFLLCMAGVASMKPNWKPIAFMFGFLIVMNGIIGSLMVIVISPESGLIIIKGLEAALVRIQNKTYGIDRETGELIPKERLRAVPHATLSVASKEARKK